MPHSLRDAFRLCKEHGLQEKRLSVERIAELMGRTVDWLYKVMADGSMPANLIPMFETITGADFVSRHLAVSSGKLVIEAPVSRACDGSDVHTLQEILHGTVGTLLAFYAGKANKDEVISSTTQSMEKLAWHRKNAADQPGLDFAGESQA